jgi:hypothetical protein
MTNAEREAKHNNKKCRAHNPWVHTRSSHRIGHFGLESRSFETSFADNRQLAAGEDGFDLPRLSSLWDAGDCRQPDPGIQAIPPRQKPAAFNLDAVLRQMQLVGSGCKGVWRKRDVAFVLMFTPEGCERAGAIVNES